MQNKPNIEDWAKEISAAITLIDANDIIIYMNDAAIEVFSDDGGEKLIGQNVKNCHNEYSNAVIDRIAHEHEANIYTLEIKGEKALIYQAPMFENGKYKGMVELSINLPKVLPNIRRES